MTLNVGLRSGQRSVLFLFFLFRFFFLCLCSFKFRMEESRLSSSFFLSLLNEHARARLYNYGRHCNQFKTRNDSCLLLLLLSFLPLEEERNFFVLYWTNTERIINCYNLRRCCEQFEISWIPSYLYQTLVFFFNHHLLFFLFFLFSFPLRRFLSFEFQRKTLDFDILTSAMREVLPLRFFPDNLVKATLWLHVISLQPVGHEHVSAVSTRKPSRNPYATPLTFDEIDLGTLNSVGAG